MSLLRFRDNESGSTKSKRSFKVILGIGALVGVIALGSTLAASINLNSGAPVEFGQGVAQAVSCAGTNQSITITPMSRFRNSEGGGTYRFSSFKVSDVPSECNGVNFTFKFYGSSGDALDPIGYNWVADNYPSDFNRTDINVHFEGEDTTGFGSNNLWDDNDYGFPASNNYSDVNDGSGIDSRTNSSFEVTFWYSATDAPGLLTDQLKSITVETSRTTSTSTGWINNGSAGGVLTLINSPALSLANGGYLDFGNSAYATGSIGSTSGLTEITVAMRMNLPSGQCGMPFYWGTDNGNPSNGYDIWDCLGGLGGPTAFGFNTWQDDIYGTNSTSFYGDFHDFVFVFSPLSLAAEKLYIDGAEIPLTIYGTPDETTNRFPENGTFTLMSNGTGGSYHENGFIAAVKIYKRALTGPEAADVFSGSAPSGAAIDVNASSSANFN